MRFKKSYFYCVLLLLFSFVMMSNSYGQIVNQNDSIRINNQPKDTTISTFNKSQYGKMISRADVYFAQKEYQKSKKMYQRAIRFQPNWNNTIPKNRIIEIDRILKEKAESIEVYVDEFDEVFQQGITEFRKDLRFNNYGKAIIYEIIRVVVIGEKYNVYKKYTARSSVTYSKNKIGISKQVWSEESNNITLKWN